MIVRAERPSREKERPVLDLDEALEESFPASDPIACAPKRGGKADKRAEVAVDPSESPATGELETTDAKTTSNMKAFHRAFERRRR